MPQVSDALIAKILVVAAKEENITLFPKSELSVWEQSGGNIDDAYHMGRADGEILLARELKALYEAGKAKLESDQGGCEFCGGSNH